VTTYENIANFKRQLKSLGFSYDWSRELATTDYEYVRWTQWIFLQLYKKGLAEQSSVSVNWCPALGTVLANEEIINGKSERGDHPVERLPLRQWVLKITNYAEELEKDLEGLQWPEGTMTAQKLWIGRSEGAKVVFPLAAAQEGKGEVEVFTTRPDTLMGVTYVVLAPEHPLVDQVTTEGQRAAVKAYVKESAGKSDMDRTATGKDKGKTGVDTGATVVHPISGEELPVWVADYVLWGYGTGAVMAVPAHDERDHAFAKVCVCVCVCGAGRLLVSVGVSMIFSRAPAVSKILLLTYSHIIILLSSFFRFLICPSSTWWRPTEARRRHQSMRRPLPGRARRSTAAPCWMAW